MGRRKSESEEPEVPKKITDIEAATWNVEQAVGMFVSRWLPLPNFSMPCEVMDQGELRDAMGLRATIDLGDPWPKAEQLLLKAGFLWHWMGASRVMYLRERDDCVVSDGYARVEEIDGETDSPE